MVKQLLTRQLLLGVDAGGTFTDFVYIEIGRENSLRIHKTLYLGIHDKNLNGSDFLATLTVEIFSIKAIAKGFWAKRFEQWMRFNGIGLPQYAPKPARIGITQYEAIFENNVDMIVLTCNFLSIENAETARHAEMG